MRTLGKGIRRPSPPRSVLTEKQGDHHVPSRRRVSPEQWMTWIVAIAKALPKILRAIDDLFR